MSPPRSEGARAGEGLRSSNDPGCLGRIPLLVCSLKFPGDEVSWRECIRTGGRVGTQEQGPGMRAVELGRQPRGWCGRGGRRRLVGAASKPRVLHAGARLNAAAGPSLLQQTRRNPRSVRLLRHPQPHRIIAGLDRRQCLRALPNDSERRRWRHDLWCSGRRPKEQSRRRCATCEPADVYRPTVPVTGVTDASAADTQRHPRHTDAAARKTAFCTNAPRRQGSYIAPGGKAACEGGTTYDSQVHQVDGRMIGE